MMLSGISDDRFLLPYNLQLFAEGPGGEKTEKPTFRRKEKAREEGQVAKSTEVTTAFFFIGMFGAIKILGPGLIEDLIDFTEETYELFALRDIDIQFASGLMNYSIGRLLGFVAPILAIAFLIAVGTNFIQVGWHPTTKTMKLKFSKLNPINGFKRIFSLKSIIELLKTLLKLAIILVICYNSLKDYETLILTIYDLPALEAYKLIANICLDIGLKIGGFFIIIALADYIYQRYDLNKSLMMTKQEVKEEYKETEGNPEIKSRIRQKMREASVRRMMQDIPKADVIITNPTHFAVAIRYDSNQDSAPVVLAKGADLVAAKIKEKAKEHNIEIVENKPLARTLYYTVEIGDEIPPELYATVAEVLAFVYSLNKGRSNPVRQNT